MTRMLRRQLFAARRRSEQHGLAHTASSDDDRVAVYFRIWLRGLEERRWHHLVNIWDGWKL